MTQKEVGVGKMLKRLQKPFGRRAWSCVRSGLPVIAAAALFLSLFQSACFFKKGKTQVTIPEEVPIILLPFNVPPDNPDLRWTAMAGPILMGKVVERIRDLRVLPLWESMPTAVDAAGVTRTFSPDTAASAAAWLSVKWSAMGELSTSKNGVRMVIDFIPSKVGSIPFRYSKSGKIDEVGLSIPEAFSQFASYLTIRPLEPEPKKLPTMTSVKKLAEALDREYGWFVEAEPGKAQAAVSELADSDVRLARFLFNPALYPNIAEK
jgi:hypothetical protein